MKKMDEWLFNILKIRLLVLKKYHRKRRGTIAKMDYFFKKFKTFDEFKKKSLISDINSNSSIVKKSPPGEVFIFLKKSNKIIPIINNDYIIDNKNNYWYNDLLSFKKFINVIASIGRLDYEESKFATGFLIKDNVLATNAHVVENSKEGMKYNPQYEFLNEPSNLIFNTTLLTNVQKNQSPDIAFLSINDYNTKVLELIEEEYQYKSGTKIMLIGHPEHPDSNLGDTLMNPKAGGYKHIQPGIILSSHGNTFTHDCSTGDGNSGSPIFDLKTGKIIGIHNGGVRVNNGIKASEIRRLKNLI